MSIQELFDTIYNKENGINSNQKMTILEENLNIINGLEFENKDEFSKAIQLLGYYGVTLAYTGFYSKAIPFINQTQKQIEKQFELNKKNIWEDPLFEELIFVRGVTNFNLKNLNLAKKDFQVLVEHYPENEKYKNYYLLCNANKFVKIEWAFFGLAFVSFIFLFLIKPENIFLHNLAFAGIFISIIGGMSSSFLRRMYLKRRKNN